MLTTYKATLRGNQLEWNDEIPNNLLTREQFAVHVTILDNQTKQPVDKAKGQQMAAALENLANLDIATINDPAAWEKEQREESTSTN